MYKFISLATLFLICLIALPAYAVRPVNSETLTAKDQDQKQTYDFNTYCKMRFPLSIKIFGVQLQYSWAKDYFVECANPGDKRSTPCSALGITAIQDNQGKVNYFMKEPGKTKPFIFVFNCDCNIPFYCP